MKISHFSEVGVNNSNNSNIILDHSYIKTEGKENLLLVKVDLVCHLSHGKTAASQSQTRLTQFSFVHGWVAEVEDLLATLRSHSLTHTKHW